MKKDRPIKIKVPSVLLDYERMGSTETRTMIVQGWWNGEGVDIFIQQIGEPDKRIELYADDIEALVRCLKEIGYFPTDQDE